MYKIGLTGGIGSGKSTVLNWLKEKNIACVDADLIAREVVEPGSHGLEALREFFGASIIDNTGALNRTELGVIVFNDAEKLSHLNSLLHGEIRQRIKEKINAFHKQGYYAVVLDVPLLIETGWYKEMDEVWLVYADHESRVKRLNLRSGYNREESERRIAAQMPLEEKKQYADVILENNSTLEALEVQLCSLWARKKDLFRKGEL